MAVQGADISHWSVSPGSTKGIDFAMMRQAGAQFCIFKATQGMTMVDNVFLSQWNNAAEMIRGTYHFLDWSADADKQAIFFCSKIGQLQLDFPPIVDFEYRVNVPKRETTVKELWSFVTRVEQLTGRVCMIYTSPDYWRNYGSTDKVWTKYPLWIANYQVQKPVVPAPWVTFLIWQYSQVGAGPTYGVEAKGIDLNWFNGTMEELYRMKNPNAAPPYTFPTNPIPPMPLPVPSPIPITDMGEQVRRLWNAHPELH